jgi:hypothetical protein
LQVKLGVVSIVSAGLTAHFGDPSGLRTIWTKSSKTMLLLAPMTP